MSIKEQIAALPEDRRMILVGRLWCYRARVEPSEELEFKCEDLKALADSHAALLNEMKVAVELANEELGIPIRRWSELIEEAEKL